MTQGDRIERRAQSRAFLLRYFPLIAVLLLDLVFLAMLDTLFANKKRALIVDSQEKFSALFVSITPIKKRIETLVGAYREQERIYKNTNNPEALSRAYEDYKNSARSYLENNGPEILNDDNHPWYRIILTDDQDRIIYEYQNLDKLREWNDWTNCLFSRSFHAPMGTPEIHLTLYYATPKGWPEIETMVVRYWIYALLFVATTWFIHIWLSRYVFRPLQRVGSAMEAMIGSSHITLIDSPRLDIEKAFNQMARNQREILFGLQIDQIVDELHTLSDDQLALEQFFSSLIHAVPRIYPVQNVHVYRVKDNNQLVPLTNGTQENPLVIEATVQPVVLEGDRLTILFSSGEHTAGAMRCDLAHESSADEVQSMAHEIKKQAENGIARCVSRSRALIEERNRFGINLATNMGHDLTNIIASGKWDLDTIQRAQSAGILHLDPKKGPFFEEAVSGLRNNLQSLQEMVDIYRSVSYIQRPRFEWINLAELAHHVRELFRRSTSHSMSLEVMDQGPVQMYAEPRLLRMALFNLMANAYQAIQRSEPRNIKGVIRISVSRMVNGRVTIEVSDNGPGIRDKEGNLLPEPEINRIFMSGYSTKTDNNGSGLGLAWVKSIVEEFHGGSLHAHNLPEGGASISMILPMRQEDEIKDE